MRQQSIYAMITGLAVVTIKTWIIYVLPYKERMFIKGRHTFKLWILNLAGACVVKLYTEWESSKPSVLVVTHIFIHLRWIKVLRNACPLGTR